MQSKQSKQHIKQHNQNVEQIELWLADNGFTKLRESAKPHGDRHVESFSFWVRGHKLILMQRIKPNDDCDSPIPFVELYIQLDATNDMNETRKSIEGYAR